MRRARYDALYDEVAAILERHDPMGLVPDEIDPEFGPFDEYDPEATVIVTGLGGAASPQDVMRIVHEVFAEWFGEEPPGLDTVAVEVWALIEPSRRAS
ncbi:MAG: hypothetical protein H0W60_05975 [Chloroflexi bacterium]|jgi:hypothetical protein|nr:hypothetical protein [Chloroflexota bacterium]MBA3958834.1 hypothetical protein [Chloroflexota bacterium]